MTIIKDLREVPDLPREIIEAGLAGELVLFVGAGMSMLLGLPSWGGLASRALEHLRVNGALNYSEKEQLSRLDAKKQLSIARLIADEHQITLDLSALLKTDVKDEGIYEFINAIGCVCVTTNYDELLCPKFIGVDEKEDQKKSKMTERVTERIKFLPKYLDEPGTVIHLHGSVSNPSSMIVTTKDYLEHYDFSMVQLFLGDLFSKKTVLFLGYGLEEAEVLEHILRRGAAGGTKDRRRFALQGFFRSDDPLYKKLHQYYEKSFGVHLLGFIRDHLDYFQQTNILRDWASLITVNKPTLVADLAVMDEVLKDE